MGQRPKQLLLTRQVITSVGEVVEKKEPSLTAGGNRSWYSHYAVNRVEVPQNIKNRVTT